MERPMRQRLRDALSGRAPGRAAKKTSGPHESGLSRSIRDVGGPYRAIMNTQLLDTIAGSSEAYNRSLVQPHLPPSTHISHNDAVRRGLVIPVGERCIEDWAAGPLAPVDPSAPAVAPEDHPDF